jgi:hypothetical protein
MAEFDIRVDPHDSARGQIRIGVFVESFELDCSLWSCSDYRRSWMEELEWLVSGSRSAVILWTWRCPPPAVGNQRGWILFLEGVRVLIQERLFVPGPHDADLDADGSLIAVKREEVNEDGAASRSGRRPRMRSSRS